MIVVFAAPFSPTGGMMGTLTELSLGYHPDSLDLFEALQALPRPVLLHSGDRSSPHGRYDIMAADPAHWISYDRGRLRLDGALAHGTAPFAALRRLVPPSPPAGHFCNGFIGYFGYPLQQATLGLAGAPPDPTGLALLQGGIYRWALVTDHAAGSTRLIGREMSPRQLARLRARLLERRAARPPAAALPALGNGFGTAPEEAYRSAFARIQRYLHAGDCYQVNLARHYEASYRGDPARTPWSIYRRLQGIQPGAFAAFLDTPAGAVLSFSPERLLRHEVGRVETAPIKGTAPRAADPARDRALAQALARSEKDRAENLMIVDLLRNDLGRVCTPGSIHVRSLFETMRLRNVHHLVSTIEGRLRPGVDALACLEALLPGGSITGAPKLRAMEIINELEPVGRSVYCGGIGYLDGSGLLDVNVAIRTMVVEADRIHCWGGGGIVAESDCDAELAEIDSKIGRLLQALDAGAVNSALSSA